MRNLILSLFVLFGTLAFTAPAIAQPKPLCPLFQSHRTDCDPNRDRWRATQDARTDMSRARQDQRIASRQYRRDYFDPTAGIECGRYPLCTIRGRQLGWSRDSWGRDYGSISLFNLGTIDPAFAGDTVWAFPYEEYGTDCPTNGPTGTQAPHGYEWHAERSVYACVGAYVNGKRGKRELRDIAQWGID